MAPKMHWFISEYNLNIILISPEAGQKGPRVYNLIVYEKINKKGYQIPTYILLMFVISL